MSKSVKITQPGKISSLRAYFLLMDRIETRSESSFKHIIQHPTQNRFALWLEIL